MGRPARRSTAFPPWASTPTRCWLSAWSHGMRPDVAEAKAFSDSVSRLLDRHAASGTEEWPPGHVATTQAPELTSRLDEIGWPTVAEDPSLVACAGLAGVELGRRLAPVREIDRLLGGGPVAGELVRSLGADRLAVVTLEHRVGLAPVLESEPVASAEGLVVHRVLKLGAPEPIDGRSGGW